MGLYHAKCILCVLITALLTIDEHFRYLLNGMYIMPLQNIPACRYVASSGIFVTFLFVFFFFFPFFSWPMLGSCWHWQEEELKCASSLKAMLTQKPFPTKLAVTSSRYSNSGYSCGADYCTGLSSSALGISDLFYFWLNCWWTTSK